MRSRFLTLTPYNQEVVMRDEKEERRTRRVLLPAIVLALALGSAACEMANNGPMAPSIPPDAAIVALFSQLDGYVMSDVLYTTSEDFALGSMVNVNADAPNSHQLQLNDGTFGSVTFPFVNIAISGRGTAVRTNTETGEITGILST